MSVVSREGVVIVATTDGSAGGIIARQFERAGYPAVEIASGDEALDLASEGKPLLVVVDLDELGDTSGYEVCHELLRRFDHGLPIILLSGTRTEPSDRLAGLLIGAHDYVTKPFEPGEIVVRAQRLLARTPDPAPPVQVPLTRRERQVLQHLAAGFSQARISKELFISSKTVGTHIQRILTKLGVHSRTEAVALAYKYGLIQAESAMEDDTRRDLSGGS